MTKLLLKRQVIELRKTGKSYSEIKQLINVSKSSLSLWLKNIPLTKQQVIRLKGKKENAIERYIETMKFKRKRRDIGYYKNQAAEWIPLSEREIYIAGLFLYLGEGNKASRNSLGITNTDPSVVKFALYWFLNCLKVPKEKIRLNLHLYSDMNIENEINFWIKELELSRSNLNRPYIKQSLRSDIDQKGYGHGTCGLFVHNTVLKENVLLAIRAITDNYSVNPNKFDIIA